MPSNVAELNTFSRTPPYHLHTVVESYRVTSSTGLSPSFFPFHKCNNEACAKQAPILAIAATILCPEMKGQPATRLSGMQS